MSMTPKGVRSAFDGSNVAPLATPGIQSDDPELKAVLTKLVRSRNRTTVHRSDLRQEAILPPDIATLNRVSEHTSVSVADAEAMMEVLPDLKLATQILVSLILSPKDLINTELNYIVEDSAFDHEASGVLIEVIRNYFDNDYKIGEDLTKIITEALVTHGSYPMAVLPETSIDLLINSPNRVALESFGNGSSLVNELKSPVGLLGSPPDKSKPVGALESLFGQTDNAANYKSEVIFKVGVNDDKPFNTGIEVIDNVNLLKTPVLADKIRQDRVRDVIQKQSVSPLLKRGKISIESSHGNTQNFTHERSLYVQRNYKQVPVVAMTPASAIKRASVGHPLVMKLPAESVIPVHVPSDPSNHLGFFVALDETSNPVSRLKDGDRYSNLAYTVQSNAQMSSSLLETARRRTDGINPDGFNLQDIQEMERLYGDLLERDLIMRLQNGMYGKGVSISSQPELYSVMLQRTLQNQLTQIVYIPAEMMTYIAFDYNRYGVGKSLLADTAVIGSLRAMLMFSGTMASIKNSIGRTVVGINLDPTDQDPAQRVNQIRHEYAKQRQGAFPLRVINPVDIASYLQDAGVEFAVTGNPRYPEMSVSIEDRTSNRAKPDTEFEKLLRDRQLMGLWLSPEMVDASVNADFAATVTQNNLLTTKRVMVAQRILVAHLSDFICKYTLASGSLLEDLKKALNEFRAGKEETRRRDAELRETAKRRKDAAETPETTDTATDSAETTPLEDNVNTADTGKSTDVTEINEDDDNVDDDAEAGAVESFSLSPTEIADSRRRAASTSAANANPDAEDDDALIFQFVNAIRVQLPQPDTNKLEAQFTAYDKYAEWLDKAFKPYLDPEFLGDLEMGGAAEALVTALAGLKAYYLRKYMRDNNMMPELEDMLLVDEAGKPLMDLMEINGNHVEGIRRTIGSYLESILKNRIGNDELIEQIHRVNQVPAGSSGSSFDTSSTSDDAGGDDGGFGGDDDGGFEDDLGGDDGTADDDGAGDTGDDSGAGDDNADATTETSTETDDAAAAAGTESYQEPQSFFTHQGQKYDLNAIFKMAEDKEIVSLPLSEITWMRSFIGDLERQRVRDADFLVPIIVVKTSVKGLGQRTVIVDGAHRMLKAINKHRKEIPARFITEYELASARL